jgi:hypothetical protein
MYNRIQHGRMLKNLALSLAAASSLLIFATPAHAAGGFPGGVFKLKTRWGGGYVLNIGGVPGSTVVGATPQIHWNDSWDNQNRWETLGSLTAHSASWGMMKNRWSGLCLEVSDVLNGIITQEVCDTNNRAQYWNASTGTWKRLDSLAIRDWSPTSSVAVTQVDDAVGAQVWMDFWPIDTNRQTWSLVSCMIGGVEQMTC